MFISATAASDETGPRLGLLSRRPRWVRVVFAYAVSVAIVAVAQAFAFAQPAVASMAQAVAIVGGLLALDVVISAVRLLQRVRMGSRRYAR